MPQPVRRSPLEAMGGDDVYGALIAPAVSVAWTVAAVAVVAVWVALQIGRPRLASYHPGVGLLVGVAFLVGGLPMGETIRKWRYAGLLVCGVVTPALTAAAVWAAGPEGAPNIAQCYVFFGCSTHLLYRRRDADILLGVMLGGCGIAMALSHMARPGVGIFAVVVCETSIVAVLSGWLVRTLFGLAEAESAALAASERAKVDLRRVAGGTRGLLERASHGLRTPLNSVVGFADFLLTGAVGQLTDAQADYVADISNSGRHLGSVLDDIAAISAVEAGHDELRIVRVDVAALVGECAAVLAVNATNRDVLIDVDTSGTSALVAADERKVKQILLNLIANAVRFSPDHGRVSVRLHDRDGGIEVAVRDEGPGIDASEHERIFLAFASGPGGTGLGLTVSQGYALQHNGRISVDSRPGEGATFRLWLPRGLAAPAPSATTSTSPPISRSGVGMWDDGGVLQQLVGLHAHRRFLTRLIGTLAFAEGLVLIGALLVPRPAGFRLVPIVALGIAATAFGAVLLWWPGVRLTPRAARVCGGAGIVGTAFAGWWAGSHASAATATVFVVIGLLGFEGLAVRGAAMMAAAIGVAYAVLLAAQQGNTGAPERWMITMALVVAGGLMARWFVNLVPQIARDEHTARAAAEQANLALARVSQRHRDVLAHVSHELRTPLNAIIGFAEVLQSGLFGPLNPSQAEYMADIRDAGRELLEFVNDILELSRAEAGKVELERDAASIRDVIAAATARTVGVVVGDVDPGAEEVTVDARRVAQALGAILASIVAASPGDEVVTVSTRARPGSVVLEVAHSATSVPWSGARSEVALLLARRLAEMHGGSVTVAAGAVSLELPTTVRESLLPS